MCSKLKHFVAVLILMGVIVGIGYASDIRAEEKPLVIAFRGDAVTMDPHGRSEATNMIITSHIFARLVHLDNDLKVVPRLAEDWKMVDDFTWEFKLQEGIRFTNGEPFNADAAKYSLERAKHHPDSQMKYLVPDYKEITAVDEYTLRFVTKAPSPELLLMFRGVAMVPPKYYERTDPATLAVAPVGAGPYKFVKWVKDDRLELVRNDDWPLEKPEFKSVIFRPIPEGATRVAALVSGEIDIADSVGIPDIPRIEKNPGTYAMRCTGLRAIYLMFDVYTEKGGPAPEMQPGIPKGKPNPFKDPRVRKAIAHGINVDEIIQYVMEGSAYPASQLIRSGVNGFDPGIKRAEYNPELAKKLLADAGFPNGFEANFDAPNDRYVNDRQVAEAIAGQLAKIGVRLNVIAQPKAAYFSKITAYKSPMFLVGWSQLSWEATMNRFYRVQTEKVGRNNRGRFSRPDLERRIDEANATMDPAKREVLRQAVSRDAYATNFILPLYYQENVYGISKRVKATCRADERLYAFEMKKP